MPQFGAESIKQLATADARLQNLFREVVKYFDCKVLEGFRGQAAQDEAYNSGHSQLRWPESNHNSWPAKGLDVAPYPVVWKKTARFHVFGGFVLGIAARLNIPIRWGGDWGRDFDPSNERFPDLVHFEIYEGLRSAKRRKGAKAPVEGCDLFHGPKPRKAKKRKAAARGRSSAARAERGKARKH